MEGDGRGAPLECQGCRTPTARSPQSTKSRTIWRGRSHRGRLVHAIVCRRVRRSPNGSRRHSGLWASQFVVSARIVVLDTPGIRGYPTLSCFVEPADVLGQQLVQTAQKLVEDPHGVFQTEIPMTFVDRGSVATIRP